MHRVVPELILENYRAGRFSGEFPAAGMFLDLSGFSKMTDALMQHGQHGAEVLAGLMYGVFDPLVRSIFEYGGRIVSFAGDGIMALFPVDGDERATALKALASAWTIQKRLTVNPYRDTAYGRFSFSVKIGLATGSVSWRILRSVGGNQATYYFRGSAVDEAAGAEHHADAGQIVLTDQVDALLQDMVQTIPHGAFHQFVRFLDEMPPTTPYVLTPVDATSSRVFMPEDVIVHDIRGEFRQIVNLFMRIPDLTDEKLEEFINEVFVLRKQYGGLLTRIDFGDKGCNLLMLWGAPVAYENDIGRALNFMLDLQRRMDFPITVGVTYYIAHAGYLGSEMCEDYTCYGWGVNLASRFMMNARPGQIWVDERVARRVSQSFDIEYVGSQHFKGFAAEQKVYVLHRRRQNVDAIYQGEMVGRQAELTQLVEFVELLWQGNFAGVAGVAGDAGIGKGRLVHAFRTSPVFSEHEVLWAVCQSDQILRQSFNPLRRWLLRYFAFSPDQTLDERKSLFDARLDELLASIPDLDLARELNRTRSILGALVDLTWDDSLYSQLDAEGKYNNTLLALIALVKAESLRRPLVLFVDDLHFIDPDTKVFLSQLKRSLSAAPDAYPVAVILAYRKQGVDPGIEELPDLEIELKGISSGDLSHLVEIVLGGPASPDLISLVTSRSEGNPYFAEQIIRYLQDENLLEMSNAGWKQVRRGRASVLPEDISALLIARLDQLKQEVKAVVQTASVLGREFEVHVLAQMLGPGSETAEYVTEAERAVIWLPLREMRYIFYHALLRDAAYSMQMRARRQELHLLALEALETIYKENLEGHYEELAYHAENGDILEKAQKYYTLAGRFSASLYQNSQAVDYFTRALAYTSFHDIPAQFDLVAERIELFLRMGKRDLQHKDLVTLENWAAILGDNPRILKSLYQWSTYHWLMGNYVEAIKCAERAEKYIEGFESLEDVFEIKLMWSLSLLRLGHLDESMRLAQSIRTHDSVVEKRKVLGKLLTVMGLIALEQKEPADAVKYLVEALDVAREIKDASLEAYTLNNLALAEGSVNGNYALARKYYERSYEISREIGDRNAESFTLVNLGFAAGMQGDFAAARSYHEQSLVASREIGNRYHETYILINLSAVLGNQNEPVTALRYAEQAVELAQEISERTGEAWGWLYKGHAHLLLGELQLAHSAYQRSIEIREELDQPNLAMEPIAGHVEAYLEADDLDSASREAEKIAAFLNGGSTLVGTDEPLRVYYACYKLFQRTRDPRARSVLQSAVNLLDGQVSKFGDEEARKRYVENIPWRRAIRDAYKALV